MLAPCVVEKLLMGGFLQVAAVDPLAAAAGYVVVIYLEDLDLISLDVKDVVHNGIVLSIEHDPVIKLHFVDLHKSPDVKMPRDAAGLHCEASCHGALHCLCRAGC
jgi:hypothetical protein